VSLTTPGTLEAIAARLDVIQAEQGRRARGKLETYYPTSGPLSRAKYRKHMALFRAGSRYRVRLMMAANRVGKTDAGCYETCIHLIGTYPAWWKGVRFTEPVRWWAAGDTSKTVRDIIQMKLLGPVEELGTGFLPAHLIDDLTPKSGISDAYEGIKVRHVSGGLSTVLLKSYDQRREAFQGTAQHGIWLDEEPPFDIYTECLLRTMATSDFPGGTLLMTFTPLSGLTELVQSFLHDADKFEEESAA